MVELHGTTHKGVSFLLRPLSKFDLDGYWETMQDEKTVLSLNTAPESKEEAEVKIKEKLEKVASGFSEIFTIDVDGNYAGNVVLEHNFDKSNPDGRLHIWIHPDYRKHGLATAALQTVIEYGFRTKYKRIFAQCKESNTDVMQVNERLGFTRVSDAMLRGLQKEPHYAKLEQKLEVPSGKALWVKARPPSFFSRLKGWFRR